MREKSVCPAYGLLGLAELYRKEKTLVNFNRVWIMKEKDLLHFDMLTAALKKFIIKSGQSLPSVAMFGAPLRYRLLTS